MRAVFPSCLDPNTGLCSGSVLRSDPCQSCSFLSDKQPLSDWTPWMCNNIPAGLRLLGGVGAGDTGADGGGEEGVHPSIHPSFHPSVQISINQDGSLHSSSYQIRQMITGIQPTRGRRGAELRRNQPAARFLEIPPQNHSVFLLLTNRLIKTMMIDTRVIKELCVSVGTNAWNLHSTNLKPRVFRSARPQNTHHSLIISLRSQSDAHPAEIISFHCGVNTADCPAEHHRRREEGEGLITRVQVYHL